MERPAIRSYRFAMLRAEQPQGIAPTQKTIPLLSGLFFMVSIPIKKLIWTYMVQSKKTYMPLNNLYGLEKRKEKKKLICTSTN